MEIILPKEKSNVESYNPRLLIIGGRPKSGKSSFAASLDNNLIIDLEDGYRALSVMKIKVNKVNELMQIHNELAKSLADTEKNIYRFITIDNATRLEEMSVPYAAYLYRQTPMGAQWGLKKGKDGRLLTDGGKYVFDDSADVRTLPNGSGWLYMRKAIKTMISWFLPFCETLILICHVKDRVIQRNAEEVSEMCIDLAGKTADILCGQADAVGLIYREGHKTWLTFEGGNNVILEARPRHLRGKKFLIAESKEGEDELVFNPIGILI